MIGEKERGYKMIIYVASRCNEYGGRCDCEPGAAWLNEVHLWDGEWYLYRQEWCERLGGWSLEHESYIKVIDDEWLKNHSTFYGCPVMSGEKYYNYCMEYFNRY